MSLKTASTTVGLDSASWNQIAVSNPSGITPSSYCTKNGTTGEITCTSSAIPSALKDGADDQFYQYKLSLSSSDGSYTPTVSEASVIYVVNATPSFDPDYPSASDGGVSASQDSTGTINIAYSIKDEDTTTGAQNGYITPTYYYSLNDGASWTEITSGLSANATTNKTVAEGSYTTHTGITWNPKAMIDDNYSATAKIRVTINDGEAANNTADGDSAAFTLDTTDPVAGSPALIIQASTTPATLTISGSDSSSITMKVGLASDLSDIASWSTYSTSGTISLATDPDTVYVQFKDAYNNTSTIASLASIETPSYIMTQDTTNLDIPEYREFVSWKVVDDPPSGFKEYRVLRSTSESSGYSIKKIETNRLINSYSDTTVVADTLYYYKIAHVDLNGNISYLTSSVSGKANGVQDVGEGGGGSSTDAPNIDSASTVVSNITTTGATITWETTDSFGSNSTVEYITSVDGGADYSSAPSQGVATLANTESALGKHTVHLTGLTPDQDYWIQLRSSNTALSAPMEDTYKHGVNGTTFSTLAGPAITNTASGSVTQTGAIITWDTDKLSDSYVSYSVNANLSDSLRAGSDTDVTSHSVALSGLSQNTTYYYFVQSADNEANTATDNNSSSYYSFTTSDDTTDPVISDVSVIHTTSTATIIWETDEDATSQVDYATDSYYTANSNTYNEQTTLSSTLTKHHAVTIASLTPDATYHFRARSTDNRSNGALGSDGTFTLNGVAPTASSIAIANINTSGATVTWTTDKASDSTVEYITAIGGDFTSAPSQGSSAFTTSHSVALTNLIANTTYYIRVKSTDSSGNTVTQTTGANGDDFTTLNGPAISDVSSGSPDLTSATITWTTSKSANAYVYYSTSATMLGALKTGTSTLATSQSITLNDLSQNQLYYYYVESTDSEDNTETDNNGGSYYYFSTVGDSTAPAISNYAITTATSTATITWDTDELATTKVNYDTTSNYTTNGSLGQATTEDNTLTIAHAVILTGLTKETSYSFTMVSADASSNETESSTVLTFTTLAERSASCPTCPVCRGGSGGSTVVCKKPDKTPPIISNVYLDSLTHNVAKIGWKTNEDASSIIAYNYASIPIVRDKDNTIDSSNDFSEINLSDLNAFSKKHLVSLYNLEARTKYRYQISSRDSSGNLTTTETYTFTTKPVEQGLLEEAKENLGDIAKLEDKFEGLDSIKNEEERKLQESEANSLLFSSLKRVNFIVDKFKGTISTKTLEDSFKESLASLENLLPSPILEGNPTIEIDDDRVVITWGTNKGASSIVLFASEDEYQPDSSEPYLYQTGSSVDLTTDHKVVIPNLAPGTTYHFQVQSKAPVGPAAISDNLTFTTRRETPVVTDSKIDKITDNTATIIWSTNIPVDSLVRYIPSDKETEEYLTEEAQIQGKVELVKNHIITIENLVPGTTYKLTIEGRDESGQSLSYDLGELNTSQDIRAPEITNVKTESSILSGKEAKIQSIIFCNTDEDARNQIIYTESEKNEDLTDENILQTLKEDKENQESKEENKDKTNPRNKDIFASSSTNLTLVKKETPLATNHITVINSFLPNTAYAYRIISVDTSGNRTLSKKYVLLTPERTETVLDMIISTFETRFSWLKNLKK